MNNLRIIGLLWLLSVPAIAQDDWFRVASEGAPAASVSCHSSDTAIPHGILLEGFQTASTGYENTWSAFGNAGYITAAADSSALSTGKPTGACSQAWKMVVPASPTETYATWTKTVAVDLTTTALDAVFYLWITTAPANGEYFYPLVFIDGSGNPLFRVQIYNPSPLEARVETVAAGGANSSFVTITTGSWIKFSVHSDPTQANGTFSINGGGNQSWTRPTTGSFKQLNIGGYEASQSGGGLVCYWDLICVN